MRVWKPAWLSIFFGHFDFVALNAYAAMVGHGACQKAVRVSGLKMMLGLVLSAPLGAPILDLQYLRVCKWSKMCNDDPKKRNVFRKGNKSPTVYFQVLIPSSKLHPTKLG